MTEIGANLQTYQVKTTKKKASSESLAFEGHKIVMTGFRDADISSFIEDQGGEVTNSVSKNTSMVICKDVNDSSGKITKAKSLGVSVVGVDQFREQYLS
jgi:NAD-dependent DNA ligase